MKKILFASLVIYIGILLVGISNVYAAQTYGVWTFQSVDGGVEILSCSDSLPEEYTIPQYIRINGNSVSTNPYRDVVSIGNNAFANQTSVKKLTIGDNIKSIGYGAFRGCSNLESLTIGENVATIGKYAFSGLSSLKEINWNAKSVKDFDYDNYIFYNASSHSPGINVIFGDSVERIPAHMFDPGSGNYLSTIKSVSFGENVSSIGEYAFNQCVSINKISLKNVVNIDISAFKDCTGLSQLNLGDSLLSLGDYAFNGCSSITELHLPDTLSSLGNYTFSGCTGITNITIPKNINEIGNGTFGGCTSLTNVEFHDNISSIGSYAFGRCTALTGITLPNSITNIGERAFYNCSSLKEIIIPENVSKLGNNSFNNCSGLESITYNAKNLNQTNYYTSIFDQSGTLEKGINVYIGNSVESIPDSLFIDCSNIKNITIGENVKTIGKSVFKNCTNIEQINWNAKSPDHLSSSNEIFYNAGIDTDGITVIFGETVTRIPASVFYPSGLSNTPNLVTIKLGSNIKEIGDLAFNSVKTITSVYVNDLSAFLKIKMLYHSSNPLCYGGNLYVNNELTTNITIPEDVTEILPYAFIGCKSITNLHINKNLTKIDISALQNCVSLHSITVDKDNTYFSSDENGVLFNKDQTMIIYYPEGRSEAAYVMPDGVTNIGTKAFSYQKNLDFLTVPVSVSEMGFNVFYNAEMPVIYYNGTKRMWKNISNYQALSYVEFLYVGSDTQISSDGKKFTVDIYNIDKNSTVILALYNGKHLVEVQTALCKSGTITFNTTKDYDNAKVMLWITPTSLSPIKSPEIL